MRRIKLDGRDASLFAHDLEDADLDFYYGHKDTFKRMWQDQGKKFWIRFMITFRWYVVNHGVLAEFPGKREDFNAIVDQAFIYIHENFIDGKVSHAHNLVVDIFVLSMSKGTIKYLEAKTISKDPFYAKDTREVFRRLFGDPSNKISYINVYFTLPMFCFFGGSLVQCLKQWIDAPELELGDESYWEPPQKLAPPKADRSTQTRPIEKKKKKAPKIPATNDGHCVDDDFKIYLEEKLKGHRFGPCWLPSWDFGDPRFVDEQNPLYDLSAEPNSDWRENLTFAEFRTFYDYLKTSDRPDRFCSEFIQYHPDILLYPPPPNRRIYDEIERDFVRRCENYYKMGVEIPKEKLPVDDYNTRDRFFVGKRESSTRLTPIKEDPQPYPHPDIFPQLEPGARLFIIRKHIDAQGLYERLVPDRVMNEHELGVLADTLFGRNEEVESPSEKAQREKSTRLVEDLRQDLKEADVPAKKKGKMARRPLKPPSPVKEVLVAQADREREEAAAAALEEEEASKEAAAQEEKEASGGQEGARSAPPPPAPQEEQQQEEEIDSLDEFSDDDDWYFNKRPKPKGPDYPTCLEEMNIVAMEDIDPMVAGTLQLMCMHMGGLELFHLARRKATLPIPDCRDDFTYGTFEGYRQKQLIDTMAVTIAKEWRKARRRRKRSKEAQEKRQKQLDEKKGLLDSMAKESHDQLMAARKARGAESSSSNLRRCTTCAKEEPKSKAYKACQRCKVEKVKEPRYYCSRDCQAVDWKKKHRNEHNSNLMEKEGE